MIKNFDYKVPATTNCVLININNWLTYEGKLLQNQKISGKLSPTFITTALATNLEKDSSIKEFDTLLISRVASDVAPYKSHTLFEDNQKYYNVPVSQVLGIFKNHSATFDNLQMLSDKVLIKKKSYANPYLEMFDSNMMTGEVIKLGDNVSKVKIGDVVFVRDNISTEVRLDTGVYYAFEERMIVGIINNADSLTTSHLINQSILLRPYQAAKVLNSSILITPDINFEDLDYSDLYNRDLFIVEHLDPTVKFINKGDILLINRDYTNYVYYGLEKYFIIDGTKYISAKIKEKTNEK